MIRALTSFYLLLLLNEPLAGAPASSEFFAGYPTFEIFTASRMWRFIGPPPEQQIPPTQVIAELQEFSRDISASDSAPSSISNHGNPAAILVSSEAHENLYVITPTLFMYLQPLWKRGDWSIEDVAMARAIADTLDQLPNFPQVRFLGAAPEVNRRSLEQMVAWFQDEVRRPQILGHMIFTMDEGPWRAFPLEPSQNLPIRATRAISASLELQLCNYDQTAGGWVLQLKREGVLAWTRLLTQVPPGEFDFAKQPPTDLGPYGWQVHMSFGEYTPVYLDDQGDLLFYFTSW